MARNNAALALGAARRPPETQKVRVTLGELIAAAYKVLGDDPEAVARLLVSPEFEQGAGRKFALS